MTWNCIVVDDDEMSRSVIKHFIKKTNFLQCIDEFSNAVEASNYLKEQSIDIIFLDINMPEMTGMELIQTLEEDYQVILFTSEKDYAIEAFEKSVIDYLVKPVEYARFLQAAQKAAKNLDNQKEKIEEASELYVRSESKLVRVPYESLLYVEALADYVILQTLDARHIVHYTMKGIENRLPQNLFARIHRSYIVNLNKIDTLEDNSIVIRDKYLPIGASYKDGLMERLNVL